MGTYAGFFLLSRFIPYATIFAYYISFLTYSFEGLQWNEFGSCASDYEKIYTLSLDLGLNRWTNILILMLYPLVFHLLALLSSFARTRPRSFWEANCPCCCKGEFDDKEIDAMETPIIENQRSVDQQANNNVLNEVSLS